jgi:xylulokinase
VTAPEPVVLGIDVGTTETKAGLVTLDGRLLALARTAHPLRLGPGTGEAEQDPEAWWTALVAVTRELLARHPSEVLAVAVDGHGPTLTAVDSSGRPTRPAITWLDTRARPELEELTDATGLRGWALGVLPAALHVERHEAGVAAATRWYLNTWEFLALRLSGVAATTLVPGQPAPASAAALGAGIPGERIAPPVAAGVVLGGVTSDAAQATGLRAGTPVVAGLVDAFASFHGAGMVEPGDAMDAGGTAGGFGVYADRPIEAAGAFCTPAPLRGRWIVGGAMAATGKALDWFRDDVLGVGTTETLISEAAAVRPGADGVVFLPYLAGERSPLWDPDATGAFAGLTVRHGRPHLVRAILEAAALALRHVAEPILAAGAHVDAMRVCGGPARSETWNQIKADVTGFRVAVPHVLETAVLGSAIVAATGVGAHPDLPAAIAAMSRIDRVIEPDPALRARYDDVYATYTALYPALRSVRGMHTASPLEQAEPVEVAG